MIVLFAIGLSLLMLVLCLIITLCLYDYANSPIPGLILCIILFVVSFSILLIKYYNQEPVIVVEEKLNEK